jgi:hypothetical protein
MILLTSAGQLAMNLSVSCPALKLANTFECRRVLAERGLDIPPVLQRISFFHGRSGSTGELDALRRSSDGIHHP